METKTGYSCKKDVKEAVSEVKAGIFEEGIKAVLFFASSSYDPEKISLEMKQAFPDAEVFGCTTAGEIISGKMLKNCVVAMALGDQIISDISVSVVQNIKDTSGIKSALDSFSTYFGVPVSDMDFSRYFGFVLFDGLSGGEEKAMEKLGDLTDVLFLGGSAGDDLKFEQTSVFANGKSYSDAAVLALIRPVREFDWVKTQSFKVLDKKLFATKVVESERKVIEFNGKTAIEAYAEVAGTTEDKASDMFMKHPLGLVGDGEVFVRSPQKSDESGMYFYCDLLEGMDLNLLESTDIVEETKAAIAGKMESGEIKGLVNFHCILRTLELEAKGETDAYAEIFSEIPTIGFSTYGEEFIGHINQTSVMLIFR